MAACWVVIERRSTLQGREGVLSRLGAGVRSTSQNPWSLEDQNLRFNLLYFKNSIPYLRPDPEIYTLLQTGLPYR